MFPTTTQRLRQPSTNTTSPSSLESLVLPTMPLTRPRRMVVARAIGTILPFSFHPYFNVHIKHKTNKLQTGAVTEMSSKIYPMATTPSKLVAAQTPWATLKINSFNPSSTRLMTSLHLMKSFTELLTLGSRMMGPNWPLPFPILLLRAKKLRSHSAFVF